MIAPLFAFILIAGSGQQTTCGWELGKWVCRDTSPPPPYDYIGAAERAQQAGFNAMQQTTEALRQREAARQAAVQDAERQAAARKRENDDAVQAAYRQNIRNGVAAAVADGRCDAAKSLALSAGDLDLAEQAMRLCKPQ